METNRQPVKIRILEAASSWERPVNNKMNIITRASERNIMISMIGEKIIRFS